MVAGSHVTLEVRLCWRAMSLQYRACTSVLCLGLAIFPLNAPHCCVDAGYSMLGQQERALVHSPCQLGCRALRWPGRRRADMGAAFRITNGRIEDMLMWVRPTKMLLSVA